MSSEATSEFGAKSCPSALIGHLAGGRREFLANAGKIRASAWLILKLPVVTLLHREGCHQPLGGATAPQSNSLCTG